MILMKCEIAKDLLALYADGLCSEETVRELEAHLAECSTCENSLAHYRTNLSTQQNTEEDAAIRPMKKVRRKLLRHKWQIVLTSTILALLLGCVGVLTVGEIRGSIVSFSTCSDIIRLNHVTKQMAKGNTQALMDALAFRWEDVYAIKATDLKDFSEYKNYLQQQMDKAYLHYFDGKRVHVEFGGVENTYTSTYADINRSPVSITDNKMYTYFFYEGDTLLTTIYFYSRNGKYFVQQFSEGNELCHSDYSFGTNVLPMDNLLMEIVRYATEERYENFAETGEIKDSTPLRMLYRQSEMEGLNPELRDKVKQLNEKGFGVKDFLYGVENFDTEKSRWIYKVWFVIENPETGASCMMEQEFMYYDCHFYADEDAPAVILSESGDIPEDIRESVLQLFF